MAANTIKNPKSLFWLDASMLLLLPITVITFPLDFVFLGVVHRVFGGLLILMAMIHLLMHWNWLVKSFTRFQELPASTRKKFISDGCLCVGYIVGGGSGFLAHLVSWFNIPLHIHLGIFHGLVIMGLLILQAYHILTHKEWIATMLRRIRSSEPLFKSQDFTHR